MFITQLEYREKSTATNWKRITFPKHVTLVSEEPELAVRLLHIIAALPAFGRNEISHGFSDAISRMTFQTAHQQFMWFAKSTAKNGSLLIDEEELYDSGNVMLMRRAFDEMTIFTSTDNTENKTIPVEETMLIQSPELEVLQKIQKGFSLVQFYSLTDDTTQFVLTQIANAPHGILILLDGSRLSHPFDVSTSKRMDLQIIAVGCTGLDERNITKKGKMISCV